MIDGEEELDFENDQRVDPANLDVEAIRQAETFFKYAKRAVRADAQATRAKLALGVLAANLEMRIRKSPEKYGLARISEAAVEATVKTRESYRDAFEEWIRAVEEAALLDKATKAMEQKKGMIETLCKLHGQQYFAGPSVPHDIVGAWQAHQRDAGKRVNEKQKATARRHRIVGEDK
jgi:hypothetical protein